ncbi:hypothetical protein [Actinomycetospora sp. CA-053990]|uniref:hypothetical protein n=1 Tax=Actinomycetospora sp. CA-053990 TaxID=3239891 RepID=UPI003D8B3090
MFAFLFAIVVGVVISWSMRTIFESDQESMPTLPASRPAPDAPSQRDEAPTEVLAVVR